MNAKLIERLRKVLALTTSPIEGEAAAATATLHRLLAQHNLDIADLEQRGAAAPTVEEKDHDLGKAAFTWKLNLAEAVAEHFFCVALVCRRNKTVRFIGRPDNVDSMKMLYAWLIDQIKRISAVRRKEHLAANPGDHVDPLRWQVQFGVGIVSRLGERLAELKRKQQDEAGSALVIHHATEISDFMESRYGYRADGQPTESDKKWAAYMDAKRAERKEEEARKAALKESDIEAYYEQYPNERPVLESDKEKAKREAREARERAKYWEREAKRADAQRLREEAREANKSPEELRAERQQRDARRAGAASAKDVNLEPFLTTTSAPTDALKI